MIVYLFFLLAFSSTKLQGIEVRKLVATSTEVCNREDYISIKYFCLEEKDTCKSSLSMYKYTSYRPVRCAINSYNMNYHSMMEEFNICLEKASQNFCLDSIDKISINLDEIGEYSVRIARHFDKIRPIKLPKTYYLGQFYYDVEKAIYMSGFKNQLNELLKKYNVQIDTIKFDDDHYSFISKDDFLIKTKSSDKDFPPKIIQGFATCECKPILQN